MEQRPPPRQQENPARRRAVLRVLAALLSVGVLLGTFAGWNLYRDLTSGINTSDVITGDNGLSASGGSDPGTDVNILLVGVDSRTDAQGRPLSKQVLAQLRSGAEDGVLNTDTIIVLHVPADGGKATAISIPRDSYVDIPGYGRNKINSAYPAAAIEAANKLRQQDEDPTAVDRESHAAGGAQLIKTVERLTGIKINHYAELNLLGFYNLTNAIGGVQVCLNRSVKEPLSGANFPAGLQTVSGGAALAFVRQRHGLAQGDFSRIRRQQVFLAAVAHKILSAGTLTNPAKLRGLIDSAKESVTLDRGWDILGFARQASNIAGGNIEFVTIPTTGAANNSHGDVVTVDPAQVRAFVEQRTGAPVDAAPNDSSESDTAVTPSELTVDVRNGSGRSGLASKVAESLSDLGYRQGKVSNVEDQDNTSVHYPPGHSDAGDQVATVLGGVSTEEDSKVPADNVRVYLAEGFSVAGIRSDTSSSSSSSSRASATSAPPPPPAPPITADGVPCVD